MLKDLSVSEVERELLEGEVTYRTREYLGRVDGVTQWSEEHDETINLEEYDEDWYFWSEFEGRTVKHSTLGNVEVVENFGGEGLGDSRYIIFRIFDDSAERFFRMNGYYQSYSGSTFDGPFEEVRPREKLITVFEEV